MTYSITREGERTVINEYGTEKHLSLLMDFLMSVAKSDDERNSFHYLVELGGTKIELKYEHEPSRSFLHHIARRKYLDRSVYSVYRTSPRRAVHLHRQGNTHEKIAKKLGVSKRTVRRYIAEAKERGLYNEDAQF